MQFYSVPVWKEAPFLRLLIPFACGILVQRYLTFSGTICYLGTIISCCLLLLFSFKKITSQFKRYWISGVLLNCFFLFAGLMFTFSKDGKNNPNAIAAHYVDSSIVIVKLEEPLSQKPNSYKSLASVQAIQTKDSLFSPNGKIIIYFQKDSSVSISTGRQSLAYGSRICFNKNLQPIKNTGNPGSFDYQQYCAFQDIYYQVYLKSGDYQILPTKHRNKFRQLLFDTRAYILNILRNYIPGTRESGLAEALLIGYKDDLDKNLVQSYSNTGVVHVIAISGLHVGLIYWLLASILQTFSKRKNLRFLKPLFIIAGLWIFSFLAGGSPSVLRSAVMFTFIVLGKSYSRKISIYNSLAASAFLLLCYNPFWLWDVGFQLSYAAVLSIVIFMKPIYNLWFVENKILDAIWKLNTVTLSAQVLTIPICLYYFHQFPNFFLITNLIAVPLSSIILLGELLLFVETLLPAIAKQVGWLLHWLIWMMNAFIERIDRLPFSVSDNVELSLADVILLYIIVVNSSIWLLKRKQAALIGALAGVFLFGLVRLHPKWVLRNQQKLIIYNIPLQQAIDFIEGNNYFFKGDSNVLEDDFLQNFHLKPSRIAHHVTHSDSLPGLFYNGFCFLFGSKRIAIIENPFVAIIPDRKINMDIIIISKNPKVLIGDIHSIFNCKQIILDASNPVWKITKWKTECAALNISCYSIPEKGAFVMIMN